AGAAARSAVTATRDGSAVTASIEGWAAPVAGGLRVRHADVLHRTPRRAARAAPGDVADPGRVPGGDRQGPGRMSGRTFRLLMAGLALAGLGIASYLVYTHYSGTQIACSTGGCETVQESAYAD